MKKTIFSFSFIAVVIIAGSCASCRNLKKDVHEQGTAIEIYAVGPQFNADSAYLFCAEQCKFGPRTMNSEAHEKCGEWIKAKFEQYGCSVKRQHADLKGYDGTILKATNIMASFRPEATTRILLCAHWDSRPWADNDSDENNHKKPVLAANDGASGIAVMLEIARLLQSDTTLTLGVDFVCLDAEDWGVPQWAEVEAPGDTWALGAQYFASHLPDGYEARFGILLDMVGGEGAQFYKEGMSKRFASAIVDKVWAAAKVAGYGSFFPDSDGGDVTDDHVPINQVAGIPTIDIIPFYRDCQASSFGPTWHTINDDMSHIDKNTLKAVGQTVIQVLYSEE